MRYPMSIFILTAVLLSGCSSRYADHGNITQVVLSGAEQQTVTADVSQTLFSAMGAKAVFDFPHSPNNSFAATLAAQLRSRGMGVNEQDMQGYNVPLHYQLVALNPQQFYVQVNAGERQFTRIWSTQDNVLAPLASQAQSGGF